MTNDKKNGFESLENKSVEWKQVVAREKIKLKTKIITGKRR